MSIEKMIEFDVGQRTYRIQHRLNNSYDIHGFNALRDQVSIHTDLISGEEIFVAWSQVSVIRFKDASE